MSRSEFDIITRYFSKAALGFATEGVTLGIGDDGAILTGTANAPLSMSMDLLVGDVHFPSDAPARAIATRALAVNLSDLAAMAATPLCFTLGLAMPNINETWLEEFSEGLAEMAQRYCCPLVGGDLTKCGAAAPVTIAIQVHGLHRQTKPVLRSGAKVADDIYVTGTLGDGALALLTLGLKSHLDLVPNNSLDTLSCGAKTYFSEAFYKPEPRIKLALALADSLHAAIDISDGLAGDLGHILKASKLGAVIEGESLPYSDHALSLVSKNSCLRAALFGGDDYELCFTAPSNKEDHILAVASDIGVAVTKIGKVVQGVGLTVLDGKGHALPIASHGYDHFRESTV
ncbi:MAG: thiamine-monophosphate kinase [Pseudohongiellaceae bacterium]|jgi:thiamine-monophosphate kinase